MDYVEDDGRDMEVEQHGWNEGERNEDGNESNDPDGHVVRTQKLDSNFLWYGHNGQQSEEPRERERHDHKAEENVSRRREGHGSVIIQDVVLGYQALDNGGRKGEVGEVWVDNAVTVHQIDQSLRRNWFLRDRLENDCRRKNGNRQYEDDVGDNSQVQELHFFSFRSLFFFDNSLSWQHQLKTEGNSFQANFCDLRFFNYFVIGRRFNFINWSYNWSIFLYN